MMRLLERRPRDSARWLRVAKHGKASALWGRAGRGEVA
jgi:hypothetical protein